MQFEKYLSPFEETAQDVDETKDIIPKQYTPLTEVSFYILMALREVEVEGGTLYNSLARLEHDGLIHMTRKGDRRKYYHITALGVEVLRIECLRLKRIYKNSQNKVWKCKHPLKRTKRTPETD